MRHWTAACLTLGLLVGYVHANEPAAAKQERIQKIHTYFSADCFNRCWTLIDKSDRSPEDVEDMLLLAQASLWHWKQREDCKPLNLSIGYWQVSRVYALAGECDMARLFGDRCLKVGQDNKLSAFAVGYAYEALARAELLRDRKEQARALLTQARDELKRIADKEERQLLEADIVSLEKLAVSADGK